jgi:NADH dehydrogenase
MASCSREAGVVRLAHVSGIGADARSDSRYIRSRGQGEDAVCAAFGAPTIIRPAVMFGPDDGFLIPLTKLLDSLPVFPMFGRGRTALQPSYVQDVAEAIVRAIDLSEPERLYELGGPRTFTYEELLRTIAAHLDIRPTLLPVPFGVWRMLAFSAEALPKPPITRNQVELMMVDNVVSPGRSGFTNLGIEPHGIEAALGTRIRARPAR